MTDHYWIDERRTLRIVPDEYPINPREEHDNAGHMVCWHSHYILGDEMPADDPLRWRRSLACSLDHTLEATLDYWENGAGWDALHRRLDDWHQATLEAERRAEVALQRVLDRNTVMLPLYLMDHGLIGMSTGDYGDPWDSGQVGWIYLTRADIIREWGWSVLTKARRAKLIDTMRAEVETYDQYLQGDVYGFVIEESIHCAACRHTHTEQLDSCWGFYGYDPKTNGMADHWDDDVKAAVFGKED